MKNKCKGNIGIILLLVLTILVIPKQVATATTKNITIEQYFELLIKAMNVTVDTTQDKPYITAAMKTGLLETENEFTYEKEMTRTECAVLTNRADIYLNGNEVTKLYENIVNLKRISDLSNIMKNYRDDVVQVFGKGIIIGYTNGKCTQDREFRGNNTITHSGAKAVIKKLVNKKKRSVMSPDGQLTRTTKLPVNAKEFDYILASFPNSFYLMKFRYERVKSNSKFVLYETYCPPVEMKNDKAYKGTVQENRQMLDKYLYYWCDIVKKNLTYRLNVNYKKINDKWVEKLCATYKNGSVSDIKRYVSDMKKNKVIIKSEIISVEPSSLYSSMGTYVRAFVKFKVTSAKNIKDKLVYGDVYFKNLEMDQWHEGYYDIEINGNTYGDGSEYRVSSDALNDYFQQYKTKILKPTFNKNGDEDFPDGYYFWK
ncbi:hypothetical protein [Anaerosporobacter faecicola]|uniref:hypothetical protein n=1 Tax=Anaerosporobacter faecicola TaxID=2718714 RepID=UPI00143B27C3|nr:hypothetical protein [Anaerosporobacter faecicola]